MARHDVIKIGYPGAVISCNHYLGRSSGGWTYVRPDAKAWMAELGWLIKRLHLEDWGLPLEVTCSGVFKDARSCPDLSNLSKCTLDGIEEVTGINDRNMRWHDGTITISPKETPYLLITIGESTLETPPVAPQSKSRRSKASGNSKLCEKDLQ